MAYKVCILNGYPKPNRDVLDSQGVAQADDLYEDVLKRNFPDIRCDRLMIADLDVPIHTNEQIASYDAYIWTGSNLTIFETQNLHVSRQIDFCDRIFEVGTPQYGSCWAVQMACIVAGGKVAPCKNGREWCIAYDIELTDAGKSHPFYQNKPHKFDAFIMHSDEVIEAPDCATILAKNPHSNIQAVDVVFKNGRFWAQQYHTEFTLPEMAKLIGCRADKIFNEGLVESKEIIFTKRDDMLALFEDLSREDIKEKHRITEGVLDASIREREVVNFINNISALRG